MRVAVRAAAVFIAYLACLATWTGQLIQPRDTGDRDLRRDRDFAPLNH